MAACLFPIQGLSQSADSFFLGGGLVHKWVLCPWSSVFLLGLVYLICYLSHLFDIKEWPAQFRGVGCLPRKLVQAVIV